MKTAIIKTSLWEDDTIYELNIDTKLLFIFLNTAPQRNTTRFYKITDRLIAAHVGLSDRALELCKNQLEDKELVFFVDGWVILGDSIYVKPATGKLTLKVYPQDIAVVPDRIKQFALDHNLNFELSTEESSGAALVYNNNNKETDREVIHSDDRYAQYKCDDVWEMQENGDVKFKQK